MSSCENLLRSVATVAGAALLAAVMLSCQLDSREFAAPLSDTFFVAPVVQLACSADAGGGCAECDAASSPPSCDSGQVLSCDATGHFIRTECPTGQLCEAGHCVTGCTEGNLQCDGARATEVCRAGAYVFGEPCAATCVSGRCVSCTPGEARCSEGGPQRCSPAGEWESAGACAAGQACVPSVGVCGACSAGDRRACVELRGNCASGEQVCGQDSAWGSCSIQPEAVDSCIPGDDANCDGTPNAPPGGCQCSANVSCGANDVGMCQLGNSTCTNGRLGPCEGAVLPAQRNCRSSADNDCDGRPDDLLDFNCLCVPDSVEACDAHGLFDGTGICLAGSRTCIASPNALSSNWGPCVGAVGPSARNCSANVDNDCNGVVDRLDTTCQCVPGTTRTCGTAPCQGTQTCVLSADRSASSFGNCIPPSARFADPLLDSVVRGLLDVPVPANQPIPGQAIAQLTRLVVRESGVRRLDGIECMTQVTFVSINFEDIIDASPLASLTNTEFLDLQDSQITDVSWARSMPNLTSFRVGRNRITDVSVLRSLRRVTDVDIGENPLTSVSIIGELPPLERLFVRSLGLTNLSLLSQQTGVQQLDVSYNPLTDVSLLDSFANLEGLGIQGTGLSCNNPTLSRLRARGLEYYADDCL